MMYKTDNRVYVTQSFQADRINDKTTLSGWMEYPNYLKKESKELKKDTEIFGKDGKSWGKLISRLDDNLGWRLTFGNKVLDNNYKNEWFTTLPKNVNDSRSLKIKTEIFGKDGKSWGNLISRLDNNLGWKLSSGSKALDGSFKIEWFTSQPKNVNDSRNLELNTEVFRKKDGKYLSKLIGRLPENIGWILSYGEKLLDINFSIEWNTTMINRIKESRYLKINTEIYESINRKRG
jgi:hypothetical protein